MSEIITVTGTVEEIIYSNPDNGYSVVGIDSVEEGQFTATGYMPFITEGESVALSGNWTTHPDYGEQFKAEYYETVMPSDEESIIKYLSSGIISGIREATAKKLIDHFGLDVLQIMLTQPSKLAEIKGISKEKAKKIGEQFAEIQSMQNIVMFLQQYGISATTAVKVHNSLGANSVELIKKNPYILSDMVDGISFKTSDTIAFNMGLPKNSIMRIRSGIIHILRSAAYTSGHVYMPKDVLIEHTVYTLKVTDDEVIAAVSELLSSKELFQDKVDGIDAYYLYSYYESEYYIARRLIAMSQNTQKFTMTEEKAEKAIDALEAKTNLYLAAEQRNAVVTALSAGCMILTGGPGTGKTTTINTIIKLLEDLKLSIALAAPTGRAAKRMSQVTGYEAKTIHRLLEYNPMDGYKRNDENHLEGDALIVDECSMIDILLFYNLMKAIPSNMRLILVGDIDQLPSVGAGNVLRDIIDSQQIPVVRLTRIFRQAQSSRIVMNAHAINAGQFPNIKNGLDTDFFFINQEDADEMVKLIIGLVRDRLPKKYGYPPKEIQVLTPMQRGTVGAGNLNIELQNALNPTGPSLARGGYTFRQGDKVMQIRNNYDKNVFNGDIGYITAVNTNERTLTVTYDSRLVEYDITELDEIVLAYAVTIHKSQGSEFPVVVMPVTMKHFVMLQRNLIYTGITRAKKICVLVGTTKALAYAIKQNTVSKRNTKLKERLNDY